MAAIKLARLPDVTPVKHSIQISPALNEALSDYAALYNETYAVQASVADLIPAMLANFLESDREFAKLRRRGGST